MKSVCAFAFVLFSTVTAPAVTIDMVTVGNPGNPADTRYNNAAFGAVDHAYQIGKFEVTTGQYTEFLNAVAKADPNGLYYFQQDIAQNGASPNYSYTVSPDWANRPMSFVTLWDAMRFANWLHNGQPTGPQGPATTEGGAYRNIGNEYTFDREPGAKFFIPTEDEWYKAAYHKNDGATAHYWDYPTESNNAPINTLPDTGNHANYDDTLGTGNHGYTVGAPYYTTEVGTFVNSPSPYGTFDQGGNVAEWTEPTTRSIIVYHRGGSFGAGSYRLSASDHLSDNTVTHSVFFGFRVASVVPEPSAFTLAAFVAITGFTLFRWRFTPAGSRLRRAIQFSHEIC